MDDADGILAHLTGADRGGTPSLETICRACGELLAVGGVSLVLMSRGSAQGVASAFDGLARVVQDEEFTLGEGPGLDAFETARPVLVDDIRLTDGRWPQFVRAVTGMGVRAVYAFPLVVGAVKLGVLVLYRDQPIGLAGEELDEALLIADLVSQLVLSMQAEVASESLAWSLDLADSRAVVHQATGMISAQLDGDVTEALVRLRGHAFAAGRPIYEVAAEVVSGELRFDDR